MLKLPVGPNDRVLEVGSGHNPHPRSDVLCDRYLEDRERAGPLKRDRPFVLGDGGRLPFRDGAFDYVLASHVAEHLEKIELFFRELARVAPAGFLETPSWVAELLFGWRKHRWLIWQHEGILHVRLKDGPPPFGRLFHELMVRDPQMTALYYRYPDLFRVRCYWQGRIPYRVLRPDEPLPIDLDAAAELDVLLRRQAPIREWLRAYLPRRLRDPIWRRWRDHHAARNRR